MKKFFGKVKYHLERILFKKFAIPNVKNDMIAKVLLKRYLPDDPVIIDCGAHDGSDSIELARLFKKAKIHSFEPVEVLYNALVKNTDPYSNILCYPVALADRDGTMDFYISAGASDASSSLLEPLGHLKDHPDTFFGEKVTVATSTIDNWANANNIKKVDMLWLDMQGFELKMLRASKTILDSVSVIHTEVNTTETYKDVPHYREYREFLESQGFRVQIEAIPAGWSMGNVLFIRDKRD